MDALELIELLKTHPKTKPAYVKAADSKSYPAESLHEKIVSKAPLDILKLQNPPASVTRSAVRDAINIDNLHTLSFHDFVNAFHKSKCQNVDVLLEGVKTYLEKNRIDYAIQLMQYSGWWRLGKVDSVLLPFIRGLVKKSDDVLLRGNCPYWIKKEYIDHDLNYIAHPNIYTIAKEDYDRAIKSGIPRLMAIASRKYKDARDIIDKKPQKLLDTSLWSHIFLDEDLVNYLKSPKFKEALEKSNLSQEQKDQIRDKIHKEMWW